MKDIYSHIHIYYTKVKNMQVKRYSYHFNTKKIHTIIIVKQEREIECESESNTGFKKKLKKQKKDYTISHFLPKAEAGNSKKPYNAPGSMLFPN